MDERTRKNLSYLDSRYRRGLSRGQYYAHEPVYGVGGTRSEPHQAAKFARAYSLLRRLSQMEFTTLLDVGGAEGYHADLARHLLSAQVVTSDVSVEASLRAGELFGLPAVAGDAHWLPYADESFDVVLCCEVLEHVTDPVAVMCEVARVARRYAVFTTEQIAHLPREREIRLLLADMESPHAELHWFLPDDFSTVLGEGVTHERQAVIPEALSQQLAAGREPTPEEIRDLVLQMTRLGPTDRPELGILVMKAKGSAPPIATSQAGDKALLDAVLAHRLPQEPPTPPGPQGIDPFLRDLIACPVCLVTLADSEGGISCPRCRRRFPIERDVPCLWPEDGEAPAHHSRWPWLTEEGRTLRAIFTAPRPAGSRLLCYLLNIELALLGVCGDTPAPDLDCSSSAKVWRAIEREAAAYRLPDPATRSLLPWWDRLPATRAEIEAARSLGANVVKLLERMRTLSAARRPPPGLPRRALQRLRRAVACILRPSAPDVIQAAEAAPPDVDRLFHPDQPASRSDVAVLLARAVAGGEANLAGPPPVPSFPDVQPNHPAYRYVEYLLDRGIMFGFPDGLYHPTERVDRGQVATFLARALAGGDAGVPAPAGRPSFSDVQPGDADYKYVDYALAKGVLSPSPDGLYRREDWLDRSEMAVLLARLLAGGEAGIPEGPATPTFPDVTSQPDDPHSYCCRHVEYLVAKGIIP
ncbi:MAG TPA: S-layer homology domain-containing protein [Armatimonadota bacterium]|nr:S-layer homology domain-containing protein [Armatimonadota bacterium]